MGKTSTKDILTAICSPQRRTVAAERSYNAEIGVPLTIGRVEPDTELCILELAMRGFGQIAELCAFARPARRRDHEHRPRAPGEGRRPRRRRARQGRAVAALPPGGTAVVPAGFTVARDDLEVVRVGEDVRLDVLRAADARTSLGTVEVDFTARHLAQNALTALATAHAVGLDLPERLHVEFTEWRNQELPLPGGGVLINDAWNANPVSMRAALEHLVALAGGRRTVAVLGEMAELGAYSEEGARRGRAGRRGARHRRGRRDRRRRRGAYGGHWRRHRDEALAVLDGCSGPATACSSRAPARWASSASPRRSRACARRWSTS